MKELWTILERLVRAEGGEVGRPRTLWTFKGPETFVDFDRRTVETLEYSRLIRAYGMGCGDADPLALVIVAVQPQGPVPILLHLSDIWSRDTVSRWHCRALNGLLTLGTKHHPGQQEEASLMQVAVMGPAHEFDEIERVATRVLRRIDKDLRGVPIRHGLPAAASRANTMSAAEIRAFQLLVRNRCSGR